MTTNPSSTSQLQAARLDASPAPDYAGPALTRYTLTLGNERVFQDVDQWGLPYNGSPDGDLYDDLCDRLIAMGHLDADALNAI